MVDCLAPTGAEALGPLIVGMLALSVGFGALFLGCTRRRGVRGGAMALAVVLAVTGIAVIGVPTPAQAASVDCNEEPAAPPVQPDQNVSFVSGGVTFFGSYRAPAEGRSGVPAALIIGGTGAVDRDGNGAGLMMDQYR